MTKTDIVKELTKRSAAEAGLNGIKLTQDQSSTIINEVLNIIIDGLKEDELVQLTGFGSFKSKYVKARKGKNPRTGEECIIPSRNQVSFTPGKILKESVNS